MLESAAIDRVNYDLPDNYWANYGASMRGLTETQLTTAGKKFVRPDEIIWLVVGDVSKIESGIRELDYGEVIKLDADGNVIK